MFIDGQAGTTGLALHGRITALPFIELIEIEPERRKDNARREELLRAADIAVLCLPDAAAREAAALTRGAATRLIDASTAHRVASDWCYGLPELNAEQRERIAQARYVTNPGCYPQGVILGLRPLIDAGVLSADAAIAVHAVSGYSGGGNGLIDRIESLPAADEPGWRVRPYALGLGHKHRPEMQRYSGLARAPLFAPMVAAYYKGMLVHVTLPAATLGCTEQEAEALLRERYDGEPFIRVRTLDELAPDGYLDPTGCNDTNRLELVVTGADGDVMITSRYDNLGKGAAGAALQNLNLMCGQPETTGLTQ